VGLGLTTSDGHWSGELDRDRSAFGVDGHCLHNDLELYLAGLLPPDSVTRPLSSGGTTIADVIAAHGARTPPAGEARSDFTAGLLVVTPSPLTDAGLAYFERVARGFGALDDPLGTGWFGAMGGRSTLDLRLPRPGTAAIPVSARR
jgi:hypothetical protein